MIAEQRIGSFGVHKHTAILDYDFNCKEISRLSTNLSHIGSILLYIQMINLQQNIHTIRSLHPEIIKILWPYNLFKNNQNIIINKMQEQNFNKQLGLVFGGYNLTPTANTKAIQTIYQLAKDGLLKDFLENLLLHLNTINPYFLFKYLRTIKRAIKTNDLQTNTLFAKLVIAFAKKIVYGNVKTQKQIKLLKRLSALLRKIQTDELIDENNNLVLNLLASRSTKVSEKLDTAIFDKLQREAFVDKKNKSDDAITLNAVLSKIVVPHFKQVYDIMKRLLMRSSSNLSLWEDVSKVVKEKQSEGDLALESFKVLQQHLAEDGDECVTIINNLTQNITSEDSILKILDQLDRTINKTYDEAKKTLYISMLEGISKSATRHESTKKRTLLLFVQLVSAITSENLFHVLSPIVRGFMLNNVTIDTKIIEQASKQAKDLSKYGLLILSNIISQSLIPEQTRNSKSLTALVSEFKSQYQKSKTKIGISAESYIASISILHAFKVQQQFSQLFQSNYLTNFAFVSQKSEVVNHFSRIMTKLIADLSKLGHQHQFLAISIFASLVNSEYRAKWLVKGLKKSNILWLISEGVYPIVFNQLQKPLKLKWNKQYTVMQELVKLLDTQQDLKVNSINWQNILSVLPYFKISVRSLLAGKLSKHFESIKENISPRVSEVINIVLDQEFEIKGQNQLYLNFLQASIELGFFNDLQPYISIFFNQKMYTQVKCLVNFDEQVRQSSSNENIKIQNERTQLTQHQYPTKPKIPKVSIEQELKMLDENEVKQQIFRKHYNKMAQYYNKLLTIVMAGMKKDSFQKYISSKYSELLACQKYPELRFQFYLFNRNLFNNEPQYRRYSQFLSDLYIHVGMNTLPTATHLEKLNVFMTSLMTQELKDVPSHFIRIIQHLTQYILRESLDISLKLYAEKFYLRLAQQERFKDALINIYPLLIQNVNLLSQFPETRSLLIEVLKVIPEHRFQQLLEDLMNSLPTSQKAILSAINISGVNHNLSFEDYVKLRILESQNDDISKLAKDLLQKCSVIINAEQLKKLKMIRFVERHSKQVSQKLCSFAKEIFSDPTTIQPFFDKANETAKALYEKKFDQQGLQFYPSFLQINLDFIPSNKLEEIFQILIKLYTSDDQMVSLNKKSMEAGIAIIKAYGKHHSQSLLDILQRLMKSTQGISSIIFLGVLAPYLKQAKNLNLIQKRITQIFESNNQNIQQSVAKCMHELMSFFENPKILVADLYKKVISVDGPGQIGKSYLISGLLKGIGIPQLLIYIQKILEPSDPKNAVEKKGKLYILSAFFDNFGRIMEPKISQVIKMIAVCMSDNSNEAVRQISKATARRIIIKLSAFGVKILLPQLLTGLEEQEHWRGKTTYIWILGNMSHCAPRQLHVCLPKIIPTLSACLSDTHPKIRQTSTEALKVIGQTIKNPEIFNNIDIFIDALSDPFHNSKKALQVLLKTRFSHFIDPPALSVIVPILNYALKGRDTLLKQYACQVIGSIVLLIQNPNDLLSYFQFLSEGIRITLCDPLSQVRGYASRAIGKTSIKIGIDNTEKYLPFLKSILASETANSIERQGAAQGLSQYICSHGLQFFEDELNEVYQKLSVAKHSQKQGYISIFMYVPTIMKQDFEPFIKDLTDNMTVFVSDQQQSIRNSSLQVQKILINNFGLSHTEMLLEPLQLSLFEEKWRKRNGALLLIGQMLNVLKNFLYENADAEKQSSYYEALMGVYILKDDDVEMPRITANQVWNTYIENTPKTIKCGIPFLVRMWSKGISEPASNIVYRNIVAFCTKYAETYFNQIITNIQTFLSDPALQGGAFEVLAQFIKRMSNQFLLKYKETFRSIFDRHMFQQNEAKPKLVQALSIFIQKMHEVQYLQKKMKAILVKCDPLNEEDPEFSTYLHLFAALCSTTSKNITELVALLILQSPLSQFKIQVLQNNSAKLANYAYSKGIITVLKGELEREIETDSSRLKSIIFCLKELSTSMDSRNQSQFLKDLSNDIRKSSKKSFSDLSSKQQKILQVQLDLLNHYLETVNSDEIPSIQQLIQEISPLSLVSSKSLTSVVNKILVRLFMHQDPRTRSIFFKQFIVCMQNSNIIKEKKVIPIWAEEANIKEYTTLLINSLCYGGIQAFDTTLSMIQTFLKIGAPQFIRAESIRFIGATLRVSNYRLSKSQKQSLHEFINYLYLQKFPLQNFQYQMVYTLAKYLQDVEDESNIKLTSNNFAQMLLVSNKKNEVMTFFSTNIGRGKEYLIRCLFYLVKRVLNQDIVGEVILSKLYTDLQSILNDNPDLDVESVYYLSRTIGRLAIHLNIAKQKLVLLVQGVTYSYAQLLQYLHYCYYEQSYPQLIQKMNVFLKDSSREKVHYLLKTLIHLSQKHPEIKVKYSAETVKGLINQTILGFEEIEECLKEL